MSRLDFTMCSSCEYERAHAPVAAKPMLCSSCFANKTAIEDLHRQIERAKLLTADFEKMTDALRFGVNWLKEMDHENIKQDPNWLPVNLPNMAMCFAKDVDWHLKRLHK